MRQPPALLLDRGADLTIEPKIEPTVIIKLEDALDLSHSSPAPAARSSSRSAAADESPGQRILSSILRPTPKKTRRQRRHHDIDMDAHSNIKDEEEEEEDVLGHRTPQQQRRSRSERFGRAARELITPGRSPIFARLAPVQSPLAAIQNQRLRASAPGRAAAKRCKFFPQCARLDCPYSHPYIVCRCEIVTFCCFLRLFFGSF